MAAKQWLAAAWPVVSCRLPRPPARVLEIGCGPLGGFVPDLVSDGYEAVGVDPDAPAGDDYVRERFERVELSSQVDAVVASASLHHVADPEHVIDRIASILAPGGRLVVVEWDWERFDQPTAEWCFQRLRGPDDASGWLHRHRDRWVASGQPWTAYLHDWAGREQLHGADMLLRLLDERFRQDHLAHGPYLFPELAEVTEEDERTAIDRGQIRATRVDYVGRLR